MPFETFVEKTFRPATIEAINHANDIIDEYRAQGFTLTLRQLYYQFVARGLSENTQRAYKRLGSILNNARLAGLVDWDAIVDRTRNLKAVAHWESPAEIVQSCASQFRFDKWEGQPTWPEVWIEKEALVGVIEPVCHELDIPYFACRGYSSQSEQWAAGKRFSACENMGQAAVVLHLGDHDPSGIDMTRDNDDRLNMFAEHGVEVIRLALNMDQVEKYDPPPNPAKETDSRAKAYIAEYGDQSWELDALDPPTIDALIREAVDKFRDMAKWVEAVDREKAARRTLQAVSDNWTEITDLYAD